MEYRKGPGNWFYWTTIVLFVLQLIFFVYTQFSWLRGSYGYGPKMFLSTILYLPALLVFTFRKYDIKHLVIPFVWLVWTTTPVLVGIPFLFMGSFAGFFLGSMILLEAVIFIFMITYSVLIIKNKITFLERPLNISSPWDTVLVFTIAGALWQIANLALINTMAGSFGYLLAIPGVLVEGLLNVCPPTLYIDYGPLPFCEMLIILPVNIILFGLLGLILSKFSHHREFKPIEERPVLFFLRTHWLKILLAFILIILLYVGIKIITKQDVVEYAESTQITSFEPGVIYKLSEGGNRENRIGIDGDNLIYSTFKEIYLINLKNGEKKFLTQGKDIENNVLEIQDNLVVYITWVGRTRGTINFHNIVTNNIEKVPIEHTYMSVSGVLALDYKDGIVVWDDALYDGGGDKTFSFFNIADKQKVRISNSINRNYHLHTNGKQIAFEIPLRTTTLENETYYDRYEEVEKWEMRNISRFNRTMVVLYDIETGILHNITSEGINEFVTDIGDGYLLINRFEGSSDYKAEGPSSLLRYDVESGDYTELHSSDSIMSDAVVNDEYLVWKDDRHGGRFLSNGEIYYKKLTGGEEVRITRNNNLDYGPEISGNKVIWKSRQEGVMLYIIPE